MFYILYVNIAFSSNISITYLVGTLIDDVKTIIRALHLDQIPDEASLEMALQFASRQSVRGVQGTYYQRIHTSHRHRAVSRIQRQLDILSGDAHLWRVQNFTRPSERRVSATTRVRTAFVASRRKEFTRRTPVT